LIINLLKKNTTMKKNYFKTLLALLSLVTGVAVQGQPLVLDSATPIKSTSIGGNDDSGRSIAYDSQGDYYVTGNLNGGVDFDPNAAGNQGPSTVLNNGQAFLAKYNSSGAFQWYWLLPGAVASYAGPVATSADGVFVAHLYDDGANYKLTISKYDFNGAALWSKTINTTGTANRINSLKTDSNGNFYIAGTFAGTGIDFDPGVASAPLSSTGGSSPSGYVAKYDGSGNYQWAFAVAGNTAADASNYESGMSNFKLAVSGNSLFLTGRFVGSNIDFDPSSATNALSMNSTTLGPIFIAKYDLSQVPTSTSFFQWVFQPQGSFTSLSSSYSARFSMPADIGVDAQGNIYTVGQYVLTADAADFDPGASQTPSMTTGASMKVYVASYNGTLNPTASGFYRWAFTRNGSSSNITIATALNYNSNYIGAIACDASGDFYLGGAFGGSNVDFNPLGTPVLLSGASVDMYIAKYSNLGICLSANSFAVGSDGLNNGIFSLATGNGKLYATGTYKSSTGIDFDPGAGSTAITSFSTGADIIVLKYTDNTLGVGEFDVNKVVIAPNPASNYTTLYTDIEEPHFRVYNLSGQEINAAMYQTSAHEYTFDMQALTNGVYFIQVENIGRFKTYKILKQ
jgi:hypothetical protein